MSGPVVFITIARLACLIRFLDRMDAGLEVWERKRELVPNWEKNGGILCAFWGVLSVVVVVFFCFVLFVCLLLLLLFQGGGGGEEEVGVCVCVCVRERERERCVCV